MEKIADKIKKLLKLAEKTNFPDEAATALGKAQALMEEHKITSAMLNQENSEKPEDFSGQPLNVEDAERKCGIAPWKSTLANSLAIANGCFCFVSGNVKICLVGTSSNVNAVKYLYSYCINQISNLAKTNCKAKGKRYTNEFKFGCVDAIIVAIKKDRDAKREEMRVKAENAGSKELALYNNALAKIRQERLDAEKLARSKYGFRSRSRSDGGCGAGREAGREAGANIYPSGARGQISAPRAYLN